MIDSPFSAAHRFLGQVVELSGARHSPFIQWCHELCGLGSEQPDETAWCSSFACRMAWLVRAEHPGSAAARSWLTVGHRVLLEDAHPGWDVVVLQRGEGPQPGPEVLKAPGHVGFFAGRAPGQVLLLGGNQGDAVTIAPFPRTRVLGVRRIGLLAP